MFFVKPPLCRMSNSVNFPSDDFHYNYFCWCHSIFLHWYYFIYSWLSLNPSPHPHVKSFQPSQSFLSVLISMACKAMLHTIVLTILLSKQSSVLPNGSATKPWSYFCCPLFIFCEYVHMFSQLPFNYYNIHCSYTFPLYSHYLVCLC